LHHAIKKPAVIKLCDELVEDGDLQMKDFKKTRIYMAKQVRPECSAERTTTRSALSRVVRE
jgi:polyhydroxyalkanoate synthesis regulator phasin